MTKDNYYLKIARASDLEDFKERLIFRLFEIFPGALTWLTLILVFLLSWKKPFFPAVFIIVFSIFWLLRTIYFSFFLRATYQKMRKNEAIDWLGKTKTLPNWEKIYHLVVFPMYKEPLEIVRGSFLALKNSDWPKEKMIVVLGVEERGGEKAKETAKAIEKEFGNTFFKFLVAFHPENLPGEIAGKGSNETWAAKKAKDFIDSLNPVRSKSPEATAVPSTTERTSNGVKVPYENIIFSSLDADTCVFPKYFSCLAYYYLTSQEPTKTSFQPVPLFINNIWSAPFFSKIFSFSSTFWQMMQQERPEKLITFSSHSMSFKTLVDVGFRQTNVVSDDSRIFWQCFLQNDGNYSVTPIFYPISMDANAVPSVWQTMKNIYKQQRRWAYGVGDISYFLFGFLKNKKIPLSKKFFRAFELIEGHWSWATAPILIFLLGWLPMVLGGPEFSQTLFSYNLPKIVSRVLTIAMLGMVGSCYFSLLLLPPKPLDYGSYKYLFFALGWLLLPAIMIIFTSIPALDAQTRWMLGKYMGFWPTEKMRKT